MTPFDSTQSLTCTNPSPQVLPLLRRAHFHKRTATSSVSVTGGSSGGSGSGHVVSQPFALSYGVVNARGWGGIQASTSTTKKEHHPIIQKLTRMAHDHDPSLYFTSIIVNFDHQFGLHVDKGNFGASAIIGLGKYTGGELWVSELLPSFHFWLEHQN